MRDRRPQVVADMFPHVDADQVSQPERGGLGPSDERPRERIHLIHAIAMLQDVIDAKGCGAKEDPVSYEVGRVLADDHALAEPLLSEAR